MTVADRIRKHLKDNGIKQTFLAEKTGIKSSLLSEKLHNRTRITVNDIEEICGVLGVTPSTFIKPKRRKEA